MDVLLYQVAASLGGVGGALAVVLLFLYRQDRKESLHQMRTDRKYMEDRLTGVILADQECRERNTRALTELTTLIQRLNK